MYKITIDPKKKIIDTSPNLYGLFFEDINRAGDGGLYGELIRNRAFDDGVIPEGCQYDSVNKLITSPTGWKSSFDCFEGEGIAGWTAHGNAGIRLGSKNTLNCNRKRALEVDFNGGYISNDGFNGVPIECGKAYRFYIFAKCSYPASLKIMLTSAGGEVYTSKVLENIGSDYKRFDTELISPVTDCNARLSISSDAQATVTLGFVSLFPKDTFMGRENGLRKSLAELMLGLKPAFLRFPGGCIVEGFSRETAFRFEDSIGPVWERRPHWLLWSYMTTNGLGFHEYMQFCEDADIDAMYVFNCGMTCQGRCPDYFDDNLTEELYEDTVHAILYATAPANSEWGSKRAENGRREPFTKLKYLEIGNENWGTEYIKRYEYFYKKLKEQFPQLIYIATDHTERAGLVTEYVDEHFYSDPAFFAANTGLYDDHKGVDIYCGEYAATIGAKEGTLEGALGEAAFLTGVERNQDRVKMTSYAPLFKNAGYVSWEPDMIVFNNHEEYVIPSYHMLKMFATNRGSYVCKHTLMTESDRRSEHGFFRTPDGDIVEGTSLIYDTDMNDIRIRFWDRGKEGEDQNHYDWILENGTSKVIHYNGWSAETICNETEFTMPDGIRHVEMTASEDSFRITLNGITVHEHTLAPIPHLTAVTTFDENSNTVITKLVNFSENEIELTLSYSTDMAQTAEMTVLTAESRFAHNSFDTPGAVAPYTVTIPSSRNQVLPIRAHSVNVIMQKLFGYCSEEY